MRDSSNRQFSVYVHVPNPNRSSNGNEKSELSDDNDDGEDAEAVDGHLSRGKWMVMKKAKNVVI